LCGFSSAFRWTRLMLAHPASTQEIHDDSWISTRAFPSMRWGQQQAGHATSLLFVRLPIGDELCSYSVSIGLLLSSDQLCRFLQCLEFVGEGILEMRI
jgi:hypothetical protein